MLVKRRHYLEMKRQCL